MKKQIATVFLTFAIALISQTAFSQMPMFDICPLKVGVEVPTVMVVNEAGEEVDLKALTADKPSVIIFYRGAWCGYCTKHLAELNDIKGEVESLGYQIFGVTVDQYTKLDESQEALESEIEVYSDSKPEAIQAFGLDWKVDDALFNKYKKEYKLDLESWSGESHHSLPVPAIFVIRDSLVDFQYVNPNYRIRLKAETLLAVLRTL